MCRAKVKKGDWVHSKTTGAVYQVKTELQVIMINSPHNRGNYTIVNDSVEDFFKSIKEKVEVEG